MTLAAYTSVGCSYPPYFNATCDGDDVVVTVRAPDAGATSAMRIPVKEFRRMLDEMKANLA